VQSRSDEVRALAAEVERGVRARAEDALEALAAVEERSASLLQAHAAELRRQLDSLERCAEEAGGACEEASPPLDFLQRFRPLCDACERLSLKPVREEIEVSAAEFEQEAVAAVATQAERDREVLQKLLAIKDEMVWSLVEERDELRALLELRRGS